MTLEGLHDPVPEALATARLRELNAELRESERRLKQLQESEERFYELGAHAREVFWILSADWKRVVYISPSYEKVFGRSCQSLLEDPLSWIENVHPDDREMISRQMRQKIADRNSGPDFADYRIVRPDGEIRWLRARAHRVFDDDGNVARFTGFAEDITQYKMAEEALHQAQKMDAVGKLTGGVAHDFNNLLAVMIGNAELLQGSVAPDDESLVQDIVLAGTRGAELTRRLLAFSRQQAIRPVATDVNQLISNMAALLRRTLGTTIVVDLALDARSPTITVDPNLLENALLNLALNSRDAMPHGGVLWIETTDNVGRTGLRSARTAMDGGNHVSIVVRDNGFGMTPDVLSCALDPFFTTKEVGHGSGMGLPMVYGFVKQSHGDLSIESEHESGTTVTIALPHFDDNSE